MFTQCLALRNVPRQKLDIALADLKSIENDSVRSVRKKALHRYFEANIPVKYWDLEMKRDFIGDKSLLLYYNKFTEDIPGAYAQAFPSDKPSNESFPPFFT